MARQIVDKRDRLQRAADACCEFALAVRKPTPVPVSPGDEITLHNCHTGVGHKARVLRVLRNRIDVEWPNNRFAPGLLKLYRRKNGHYADDYPGMRYYA